MHHLHGHGDEHLRAQDVRVCPAGGARRHTSAHCTPRAPSNPHRSLPLPQVSAQGDRQLASILIDLSKYASISTTRNDLEMPLPADGSVGTLRLTLVSRWLKNYTASDDSPSVLSGVTDLSSAGTAADPSASAMMGAGPDPDPSSAALGPSDGQLDGASPQVGGRTIQERAIESEWAAHLAMDHYRSAESSAAAAEEVSGLKEELGAAVAENARLQAEVRRLQGVVSKVSNPNAVALAEHATELELKLSRAERERADVEERIAQAFTSVIVDLERQIDALQSEVRGGGGAPPGGPGRASPAMVGTRAGQGGSRFFRRGMMR
mmetsp:Transcript_3853/g.12889  ORF Transcript_3853/g.12889 Transcript_3853/m.12889 type:complete len:321 (-) Transcript_3853:324-1286(-)